jgi:talin
MQERSKIKKNNLPILLGISKSSVIKMNAETKEVIMEWKLTQVRRWAHTSNRYLFDHCNY